APIVSRGPWSLQQTDGALKCAGVATAPGSFPPGRWNHVVVTGKKGVAIDILVNGQAAGTGQLGEEPDPAQAPLVIGKGFTGLIDDVRIYGRALDRKSTRLNSSHANISYAVFCLKKKK